jgi:type 2 lantibiotic biosynthesis protein LanM
LYNFEELASARPWSRAEAFLDRLERARESGLLGRGQSAISIPAKQIEKWKAASGLGDDSLFRLRLRSDSISEHDLAVLVEPAHVWVQYSPNQLPLWLELLVRAVTDIAVASQGISDYSLDTGRPSIRLFKPLVDLTSRHILRVLENVPAVSRVNSGVICDWAVGCAASRIETMSARTIALELNVARLRGKLSGETPAARFENFLDQLSRPADLATFWLEYPSLARQCSSILIQGIEIAKEFASRLAEDWTTLNTVFSADGRIGEIESIDSDYGDYHSNGRSVSLVTFSTGIKIMYKPRPILVELHFQRILSWLNDRGATPAFRVLKLLARRDYGWAEFVEPAECLSQQELVRFYRRQGANAVLLRTLACTDIHFENVIASGEHPVLVDVETLLHPRVPTRPISDPDIASADEVLRGSVLSTGLLPVAVESAQFADLDMSGLAHVTPESHVIKGLTPIDRGTDAMRFIVTTLESKPGKNVPTMSGRVATFKKYSHEILRGFLDMYDLLLDLKEELLESEGPLRPFPAEQARAILRRSQEYSAVLEAVSHPDMLRDALERDFVFDRLWRISKNYPYMVAAVSEECRQLRQHDIPRFEAVPESRALLAGGREICASFFSASGMTEARERIASMGTADRAKQRWFLHMATTGVPVRSATAAEDRLPAIHTRDPFDLGLSLAIQVREHLEHLSIGDAKASWIHATERDGRLSYGPCGIGFYHGLSGIFLFLGQLAMVGSDSRSGELSQGVLSRIEKGLDKYQPDQPSGLSGVGGIVYALASMARAWNSSALLSRAVALVERFNDFPTSRFEFLDGLAGWVGVLVRLHQARPSAKLAAMVRVHSQNIVDRVVDATEGARHLERSIGAERADNAFLLRPGFAHGTAGIAWALNRAYTLTGDEECLASAQTLLNLGDGNPRDTSEMSWCNGAIGLAIARHSCGLNVAERHELSERIGRSLQTCGMADYSLCHGLLGFSDLFVSDGPAVDSLESTASMLTQPILQELWTASQSRYSSLADCADGVGLMAGLAGVGYGLLRIVAPSDVPSILRLE